MGSGFEMVKVMKERFTDYEDGLAILVGVDNSCRRLFVTFVDSNIAPRGHGPLPHTGLKKLQNNPHFPFHYKLCSL